MAGPCVCRSSCWNFSSIGKDKLAGAALTKGSGIPTPILIVLRAPILALAIASATAPSLDNELFKKYLKTYLDA